MKILLVDDDESIRDLFTPVLQKAGYETIGAQNGKEALDKVKTEKPDLILLDQILPDISGNDILRKLKADDTTNSIPVAIISNYSEEKMMQEAIKIGAVDYILKYQIETQDLLQRVDQIIRENKDQKEQVTIKN